MELVSKSRAVIPVISIRDYLISIVLVQLHLGIVRQKLNRL